MSLYDALISAGSNEEKARRAAEDVANFENQFRELHDEISDFRAEVKAGFVEAKADLSEFKADVNVRFAEVHSDLNLLKWMFGASFAGVVALLIKAFF
jgi:outer membrane murein-binding lipoprotein Lpp